MSLPTDAKEDGAVGRSGDGVLVFFDADTSRDISRPARKTTTSGRTLAEARPTWHGTGEQGDKGGDEQTRRMLGAGRGSS